MSNSVTFDKVAVSFANGETWQGILLRDDSETWLWLLDDDEMPTFSADTRGDVGFVRWLLDTFGEEEEVLSFFYAAMLSWDVTINHRTPLHQSDEMENVKARIRREVEEVFGPVTY